MTARQEPVARAATLLRWYDRNARILPWRVGPKERRTGGRPDPYRVWLSEIMLQQTTVAAVAPRFLRFVARWPDFAALAAAAPEDVLGEWAGLGYYARARNLKACADIVARDFAGELPDTEEGLRALPGIGAYAAAAIAAIAFDRRAVVVDGNVERVTARLFAVEAPMPSAKPLLRAAATRIWPKKRSGDFAQALMDLGATVCTPKSPDCGRCPLRGGCAARARGIAALLPRKAAKAPRPVRRGIVYALVNAQGEMLFERRPQSGLLGGMLGLPGTDWTPAHAPPSAEGAPAAAAWRRAGGVRHVFTHFALELDVMTAPAPGGYRACGALAFIAPDKARLPTVMRKAAKAALGAAADRGGALQSIAP